MVEIGQNAKMLFIFCINHERCSTESKIVSYSHVGSIIISELKWYSSANQQGIQMGLTRMKTFAVAVAFTLHLVCVVQCLDIDLLNKQATYVDAKVGSYAVFNCPLDFPQDIEIPYILHWNKEVSEQQSPTKTRSNEFN